MLSKAKVSGSKIVLTFDDVGQGLRVRDNGQLQEFAIAGADRKWHWAEAKIVGKDKVEVWSSAAPFRTDDWPGPTDSRR